MLVNLIADELEIKRQDIFLLDEELDMHPTTVNCGASITYDYNEEDTAKIMKYFSAIKKKKQEEEQNIKNKKKKDHERYIEMMKKLHPLVKDERCFNLFWFPDTVPNCFKGADFED